MKHRTSDALEIIYDRYFANNAELQENLRLYEEDVKISRQIYRLRKSAGLTQKQLAEKIGTSPTVISRLEDNIYTGHSQAMLQRIADALGVTLEIKFVERSIDNDTCAVSHALNPHFNLGDGKSVAISSCPSHSYSINLSFNPGGRHEQNPKHLAA
ncbi:MAG TPA: helix-turn-helix transcriptional regulator [Candidatus Sumerlaeota bacterium]|nr:helix-turn-helix transcriptional regulator [Candidatus Sumerlaeota bacterium]